MKLLIISLALISLVGCATPEPRVIYKTEYVNVPVYQVPTFTIPDKPVSPTDLLVETDDAPTIGKAYVSTKIILEGYITELLNLLQAIKKAD